MGAIKVVILAGGMGTRLREETEYKPKPMVEIGGRPILWHIMKLYAYHGFNQFVICLGYKGDAIREYFLSYETRNRDFTVRLGCGDVQIHGKNHTEDGWSVTLADTGEKTLTGGRIKRIERYLAGERFMATYGDGVANLDVPRLLAFHQQQGRLATVTAVRPSSRYGELAINQGLACEFREKPQVQEGWINGGFFIFEPAVFEFIEKEQESIEEGLLVRLVERGQLAVYQHEGFWQCMDTYREMELLNALWASDRAPWRVD